MASLPEALQASRGDLFKINPSELVVDDSTNGRAYPVEETDIRDMAKSLIANGQLQPIPVRKIQGKGKTAVYATVAGYTRTKAAILISQDEELLKMAEGADPKRIREDGVFPLSVFPVTANAEQAFELNVIENAIRTNLSPMDHAKNHERLRIMGRKNADIARLTGMKAQTISRLKNLLLLEDQFQLMVHKGEMSVEAAILLLDLPPEQRSEVVKGNVVEVVDPEVITSITTEDFEPVVDFGEITEVTTIVIEGTEDEAPIAMTENPKPKAKTKAPKKVSPKAALTEKVKEANRQNGKSVARTMKDIRTFLSTSMKDDCDYGEEDVVIKEVLGAFLAFVNGDIDETAFLDDVTRIISG
jgi:ParB-like chromosome segregation protein Spo0J